MKKIVIAAVAATLLGSTSLALANDSGRKLSDTESDFWAQEYAARHPGNNLRNAQASVISRVTDDRGQHAVQPVTNEERQLFANATPSAEAH